MNNYNFNLDDIRTQVLDFMRANDIDPPDEPLIIDGLLHRYKTKRDHHGETSGAYCIFPEDWPAGWVQDWRKGDAITWSFDREKLGGEAKSFFDDERYKKAVELSKQHQEQLRKEREHQKAIASEQARILFEDTPDTQDDFFPYLQRKMVKPYGVKFLRPYSANDEIMLVPLYNINGRIQSLEYIYPDGSKKYFLYAPKKGGFCPIGLQGNPDTILVGEGYATMATVHMLTGKPCVAAMDCGNLLPVCEALKEKYPKARIIITADNDHKGEHNAGMEKANEVCNNLHLAGVVAPEFSKDDDGTDWNDYYIAHGAKLTAKLLHERIRWALLPKRTQELLSRVEQINAQDLRNKPFAPIKWAVPGFLPSGCAILAGGPKIGKSILALHIAVGVAIGGCVLGKIFVEQGDVLYLALEDSQRRLQNRINGSDILDDCDLSRLTLATVVPRQHEGGMEFLQWWLDEHMNARLVIIDTLQKFRKQLTGKGTMYAEDYDVVADIKALGDKYDVPILIIHHLKKAMAEDWLNEISGSQGIAGAADTIFSLKRARTDNKAILQRTGRDVEEKDFALRLDGFGWVLEGDASLFTMPEWKRQILDYLKEHNSVSPMTLSEAVNISIEAAQKNLQRLAKDGTITRVSRGTYQLADK